MQRSKDNDDGEAVDFGLVLVVGSSSVTRVVVSSIAEGVGLRADCRAPDEMEAAVDGRLPAIAILDGGADGRDCDEAVLHLCALRRPVGRARAPVLILLGDNRPATRRPQDGLIDVVLGKPVTPDRLQPIIRDMMDRLKN